MQNNRMRLPGRQAALLDHALRVGDVTLQPWEQCSATADSVEALCRSGLLCPIYGPAAGARVYVLTDWGRVSTGQARALSRSLDRNMMPWSRPTGR